MSLPFSSPIALTAVARALERAPKQLDAADHFAAVAIVLREASNGGLSILLIERASHEHDPWSGHMAFPGGRRDDGDPSLFHTAIRETREEVGIDLAREGSFLGCLDDVSAVARGRSISMIIRPHVFHWRESSTFASLVVDPREVAEALWVNLDQLASGRADTRYKHRVPSPGPGTTGSAATMTYDMPAYEASGKLVWGLTQAMICSLLARLRAS